MDMVIGKIIIIQQNKNIRSQFLIEDVITELLLGNDFYESRGKLKGEFRILQKMTNQYLFLEIEHNIVLNIFEIPKIPFDMQKVVAKKFTSDNYALSVEKFGRFNKDKLDYMNYNGSTLFHIYTPYKGLIKKISSKLNKLISLLENQKNDVVQLNLKQHWRMVIGLGNASAYNNGFTFHPIYGIPYIPGQAVKASVRSYIIQEYFNDEQNIELKAMQNPLFCLLFGCTEKSYDGKARKGIVDFMDAFPVNSNFSIEPDIMNPHYGDYYNDKTNTVQPTDSLKPSPIIFLTIKNAEFQFNYYLPKNKNGEEEVVKTYKDFQFYEESSDLKLSELINVILSKALSENGIGAKTAVGYGKFII